MCIIILCLQQNASRPPPLRLLPPLRTRLRALPTCLDDVLESPGGPGLDMDVELGDGEELPAPPSLPFGSRE